MRKRYSPGLTWLRPGTQLVLPTQLGHDLIWIVRGKQQQRVELQTPFAGNRVEWLEIGQVEAWVQSGQLQVRPQAQARALRLVHGHNGGTTQ